MIFFGRQELTKHNSDGNSIGILEVFCKLILKFTWKNKHMVIAKKNVENKDNERAYYKVTIIKTPIAILWGSSGEQCRRPKDKTPVYVIIEHVIKLVLEISGEGMDYSVKNAGTVGYLFGKKKVASGISPFHLWFQAFTEGLETFKWKWWGWRGGRAGWAPTFPNGSAWEWVMPLF